MTNSYKKGYRGEKEMRELCEKQGFDVTWHNEDPDKPDLTFNGLTCEVKYKKSVPKSIYKWINKDKADCLAVKRVEGRGKAPRKWLITMRLEDFFKILKENQR